MLMLNYDAVPHLTVRHIVFVYNLFIYVRAFKITVYHKGESGLWAFEIEEQRVVWVWRKCDFREK